MLLIYQGSIDVCSINICSTLSYKLLEKTSKDHETG